MYYQLGKKITNIDNLIKTDAIVLISGHDEIEYLNRSYQTRYNDFLTLNQRFEGNQKIFLLGRNQIIPETKILKSLILEYGISKNDIIELTDPKSNTRNNLIYIYEALDEHNISNVTIVTSPYHTLRSKLIWKKLNFDIDAYFYSKKPKEFKIFSRSVYKKVINYEYVSLFYNKIKGWL